MWLPKKIRCWFYGAPPVRFIAPELFRTTDQSTGLNFPSQTIFAWVSLFSVPQRLLVIQTKVLNQSTIAPDRISRTRNRDKGCSKSARNKSGPDIHQGHFLKDI